jgi:hypothetical protein
MLQPTPLVVVHIPGSASDLVEDLVNLQSAGLKTVRNCEVGRDLRYDYKMQGC